MIPGIGTPGKIEVSREARTFLSAKREVSNFGSSANRSFVRTFGQGNLKI